MSRLEDMKKDYENVKIPDELNIRIEKEIAKSEPEKR